MNTPNTYTDLPRGTTPDALPPQLEPEVEALLQKVLEEAVSKGGRHVNALLGRSGSNHPTRLILEALVERLQDELGHGPAERPDPGHTWPESYTPT